VNYRKAAIMGSEKLCLRWNEFESTISGALQDIRNEKEFFDVTLACEDSQLDALKVILSACSPFFRSILRRNPHNHPLLYLKGVKYNELLSILNFMYLGEANVSPEELNSFLAMAEELKVEGLTQKGKGAEPTKSGEKKPPERVPAPAVRRPPAPPQPVQEEEPEIEEVTPVVAAVKAVPAVVASQAEYQQTDAMAVSEERYEEKYEHGYEGYDVIDAIESKMWKNSEGLWECSECSYSSRKTTNMRNHIEVKHVHTPGYYCLTCSLLFRTKNSLNVHKSKFKH